MNARRFVLVSLGLAAAGLAALVVGLRVDATRAWFAYLDAWLFGTSIAVGRAPRGHDGARHEGELDGRDAPPDGVGRGHAAALRPALRPPRLRAGPRLCVGRPRRGRRGARARDRPQASLAQQAVLRRADGALFPRLLRQLGAAPGVVDGERRASESRARTADAPPLRRGTAGRGAHAHVGVVRLEHVAPARLVLDDVRLLLHRRSVRRRDRAGLRDDGRDPAAPEGAIGRGGPLAPPLARPGAGARARPLRDGGLLGLHRVRAVPRLLDRRHSRRGELLRATDRGVVDRGDVPHRVRALRRPVLRAPQPAAQAPSRPSWRSWAPGSSRCSSSTCTGR